MSADIARLRAEIISWQDRVTYLETELDADAKHAALAEGEFCDVCTHLESEQVQQWMNMDLLWQERAQAAEGALERVRALADEWESRGPRLIDGPEFPLWSVPIGDATVSIRAALAGSEGSQGDDGGEVGES